MSRPGATWAPRRGHLWVAFATAAVAALLHAGGAEAQIVIGDTYWAAELEDTGPYVGRWAGFTGPGFSPVAAQNNVGVTWEDFTAPGQPGHAIFSVRSYSSNVVYTNRGPAPPPIPSPNVPGVTTVDINTYPYYHTPSPSAVSTFWDPVTSPNNANEALEVRQTLRTGGWDYEHNFLRYELRVCNLSTFPVDIGVRLQWDSEAGSDGPPGRKAWAGPGFALGPYDNIMEVRDYPTEKGISFTDAGGPLAYIMTINDDPVISWLPDPPTPPDRYQFWHYFDFVFNTWEPTGSPGGPAGDPAVLYFWGYHTPITLTSAAAANPCAQFVQYFLPIPSPEPPEAAFSFVAPDSCLDSRVSFTDLSQAFEGGTIVSWSWDFGDGGTSTLRNPTHQYTSAGTYPVQLTVMADNGLQDTVTVDVLTVGDPNCCPSLMSVADIVVREGDTVRLLLQALDPESDPLTFFLQGDVPARAFLGSDGRFVWPTRRGDAGNYTFTATVTDGCPASATLSIQVLPLPEGEPPVDSDWDGVIDPSDNCPGVPNHGQEDADRDGVGDACSEDLAAQAPAGQARRGHAPRASDIDLDGVDDRADNCPANANPAQEDQDGDATGDACDGDLDGDGVANERDNCARIPNGDQADADGDGIGDACALAASGLPAANVPQGKAVVAGGPSAGHLAGAGWAAAAFAATFAAVLLAVALVRRRR